MAVNMTRLYRSPKEHNQLIEQYLETGQINGFEVEWRRKDGAAITVRLSGRAVEDALGRLERFEFIAEDVTERRSLEAQLRQAQKMEARGRLASGVAHDFNNLLTVIAGYSDLLLRSFAENDPRRKQVEEIKKAGERGVAVTRQLLASSRKQVLQPTVLDLNAVVADMDKMLGRLIGEDVELLTFQRPELQSVRADLSQIEQVILNLVINSRDAMPRGGRLTIETANVELDEYYSRNHMSGRPGPYMMLAVSDTGCGMDLETHPISFSRSTPPSHWVRVRDWDFRPYTGLCNRAAATSGFTAK